MSLYKTQCCRHFDEAGTPIKPYCSQGNKCRFIHPNDYQWSKLKRRISDTPSPQNRDVRSKGNNRQQVPPDSPFQRPPHSSPLPPQADLFKRKQKDTPRALEQREWPIRQRDRRRDFDSWERYVRDEHPEQSYSLKRTNGENDPYPNQRPRLSERSLYRPASTSGLSDTHHTSEPEKIARASPHTSPHSEPIPRPTTKTSDIFHRLAQVCSEVVQDTCLLDREEDKLKAFTGLSSELSRAAPGAAMAVTPALATVINGHTKTRERIEDRVQELEALWTSLFSMLEADVTKVVDARLGHAMSVLDKERDNILREVSRSQQFTGERPNDETPGPRQLTDFWRETGTDRATAFPQRSGISFDPRAVKDLADQLRLRGSPSTTLVPPSEGDLGASLRTVLEDMKMQMDRQTRAIELLAKENLQLKSANELNQPHVVPAESSTSSQL